MTGSAEAHHGGTRDKWLARLASRERRYLLVDGGGGAGLLALPMLNQRLRSVSSPRHAELLLISEPVSRKLAPSIVELYQAMPRPRGALVIGEAGPDSFPDADLLRVEEILPAVERVPGSLNPGEIVQRVLSLPLQLDQAPTEPKFHPIIIPIPGKQERELATEPVVFSLGPVQPLTAGPLRLLLIADGEQIVTGRTEVGYASRDVARAMTKAPIKQAASLASLIDPLAPLAGRIAYVTALEKLQGRQGDQLVRERRGALLALERAQNHIVWLIRFAELLRDDWLASAGQLNSFLANVSSFVKELLVDCIAPGNGAPPPQNYGRKDHSNMVAMIAAALASLRGRLERDRALALRTAGIGVIPVGRLRETGASGPVLTASERGKGDVKDRLLTRLDEAAADLRQIAAFSVEVTASYEKKEADWSAPAGEAEVEVAGPRGTIKLTLTSDGGRLTKIVWQRPSAALLEVLPELLAGQKLADAEVIVASLDLSMAEADG